MGATHASSSPARDNYCPVPLVEGLWWIAIVSTGYPEYCTEDTDYADSKVSRKSSEHKPGGMTPGNPYEHTEQ